MQADDARKRRLRRPVPRLKGMRRSTYEELMTELDAAREEFAGFTRPLTVCAGWLVMAGLVAAAVTYLPSQQGFTQTVVVEGITLVLAGFAAFVKLMSLLPERYVFALFLAKRMR